MPVSDPPVHLFDLDLDGLSDLLARWGLPRYRAAQVLGWVYRQGVIDPQHMTNLPQADRQTLSQRLRFTTARIVRHQIATDGTQKLLMDWRPEPASPPQQALPVLSEPSGRGQTECVMIPALRGRERRTACVSSQIGCPVGCRFCASGLDGLEGNLTAGQIVEQVWRLGQLPDAGRITHVVFMGMGEPLANFPEVTRAIRMLMADWGLGISGRRITLSTVGLPAQIRRLADLNLPITLAISLHAPDDDLRRRLIPWAQHVSIQQIIDAGRYYFDRTSREVTLEYILLRNVNDRPQHARQLARVARLLRSNVNLIRYNEVRSLPFDRPTSDDVHRFQQTLRQAGVNVHIRASRGRDIAAACGQLRHQTAGR